MAASSPPPPSGEADDDLGWMPPTRSPFHPLGAVLAAVLDVIAFALGLWQGGAFWAWFIEVPAAAVVLAAGCAIQMRLDKDSLGASLHKAWLVSLLVLVPSPLFAFVFLRSLGRPDSALVELLGLGRE